MKYKIGEKVGSWEIINIIPGKRKISRRNYFCKCICGKERLVSGGNFGINSFSCGCQRANRRLRPFESAFNKTYRDARARKIPFTLTYEDFLSFTEIKFCHYCNKELIWKKYRNNISAVSNLDRKDSSIGYEKNNLVACCGACNWMKNSVFSYEEFKIVRKVISFFREDGVSGEIRLHSGELFNPIKPNLDKITIQDIAYGLAGQFRFGGHTRYTVAQHSVLGSQMIQEPKESLAFLLHDGAEGLGLLDLPSPIKKSPGLEIYSLIEERLLKGISKKFGVSFTSSKLKEVDTKMFRTERSVLFGIEDSDIFDLDIEVWSPKKAEREFLKRFYLLTGNSVKGNNTSDSSGRAGVGTEVDSIVAPRFATSSSGSGRGTDVRGETGGGGGGEVSGKEVVEQLFTQPPTSNKSSWFIWGADEIIARAE